MAHELTETDWINIFSCIKHQREYVDQWVDDSPAMSAWSDTLGTLMSKLGDYGANMAEVD